MVRRLVWDQDGAGSIPVTPTISSVHNESDGHSIFLCLHLYFVVWSSVLLLYPCPTGYMVDLVALLIFLWGEVKSRLEQAGEIFGIAKARAQSHLTDRVELALQKVRCKIKLEVDYVSYR